MHSLADGQFGTSLRYSEHTPTVPKDAHLPHLRLLLDPVRMTSLLQIAGLLPADFRKLHISYIRYKPGTNCIVLYEIEATGKRLSWIYGKLHAEDRIPRDSDKFRLTSYFPDLRLALSVFPRDLQLPALRLAAVGCQRRQLLRRLVSPDTLTQFEPFWGDWVPVRYKPERRCVLQGVHRAFSRRGQKGHLKKFYARFYSGPEAARTAYWHRCMARSATELLRVPILLGRSRKYQALLVEGVRGVPLGRFILESGPNLDTALELTARALAEWHRLKPPPQVVSLPCPAEQIEPAAGAIEALLPGSSEHSWNLAERLLRNPPPKISRSLLHGDFYFDQVLIDRLKSVAFVDLDELALGEPAYDVANFCAHLRLLAVRGVLDEDKARLIVSTFLERYGASGGTVPTESLNWHLSAALFRLVPSPFRRWDPNWPRLAQVLLHEAILAGRNF